MSVFDEDVRERRALIASARRRVGGGRSRRCSLPSDGLSAAQRGRLNGPVRTYALGRPMSWEQFRDMPPDLQRRYLARLRERFGLGPRGVARRVFRVEEERMEDYAGERSPETGGPAEEMTPEQWEALQVWLSEERS